MLSFFIFGILELLGLSIIIFIFSYLFEAIYIAFFSKMPLPDFLKYLIASFVIIFVLSLVAYFLPLILGYRNDLSAFYFKWYEYILVYLIIVLKLVYKSAIISLLVQPILFLFLFVVENVKKEKNVSVFIASVIVSFILLLIFYILPWIPAGIFYLFYFR